MKEPLPRGLYIHLRCSLLSTHPRISGSKQVSQISQAPRRRRLSSYVNRFGRGGYPNGGKWLGGTGIQKFFYEKPAVSGSILVQQAPRDTAIACRVLSKLKKRSQPEGKSIRNGTV